MAKEIIVIGGGRVGLGKFLANGLHRGEFATFAGRTPSIKSQIIGEHFVNKPHATKELSSMIKINQKLGLGSFAKLAKQLKVSGVDVVAGSQEDHAAGVSSDHVIGRVTNIFNLGKKLDIETTLGNPKGEFRFGVVGDRYFLFKKA